jgi:hypothetical protein
MLINQEPGGYVWMQGFGGEDLLFFFKLRTLKNMFKNELNVIEILYDHLKPLNLLKYQIYFKIET